MSDFYLHVVQDDILQFLFQRLTDAELRKIRDKYDILNHIDEETENEIRDHIWDILWSHIRWGFLVRMIQERIRPDDEDDEENGSQPQSSDDECD